MPFQRVKVSRVEGMDDYSPAEQGKRRRGGASLEIELGVLSSPTGTGKAVVLKGISAGTGMPSAKVHCYLASFLRTGIVSRDEHSTR